MIKFRFGFFIAFGLVAQNNFLYAKTLQDAIEDQIEGRQQEYASAESARSFGIPIIVLEEPGEAERIRGQDEETRQREMEDVAAQKSMAESAKMVVWLTVLQIFLAFLGTIALIYSLILNRRATNAAIEASKSAREALGADRAWLLFDNFDLANISNSHVYGKDIRSGLGLTPRWKNVGRSPATGVVSNTEFKVILRDEPQLVVPDFELALPMHQNMGAATIGPGGVCQSQMQALDDVDTAKFKNQEIKILIHCRVWYYDVYHPETRRESVATIFCVFWGVRYNGGIEEPNIGFSPMGAQNYTR